MKLRHGVVGVAALAIAASVLAQGPRLDGKWEIITEVDLPGMPMKMPPMTVTRCVTKKEAADPQKSLPSGTDGRGSNPGGSQTTRRKATR